MCGMLFIYEISQISKVQSEQGNGRCLWDDVIMNVSFAAIVRIGRICMLFGGGEVIYNHRRGFLRCSFGWTGQCESLEVWNG